MPRKHVIVRKILENAPPKHFLQKPYHVKNPLAFNCTYRALTYFFFQLDLLDAISERNTIVCQDDNVTLLFLAQSLYKTFASSNPGKFMTIVVDSSLIVSISMSLSLVTNANIAVIDFPNTESIAKLTDKTDVLFLTPEAAVALVCCQHNGASPPLSLSSVGFNIPSFFK